MSKVLFISQKTIGNNMAGPGIRVWELAKYLVSSNDVSIAAPKIDILNKSQINIFHYSFLKILKLIMRCDAIVVQNFYINFISILFASILRKKIVVDAYSPFYLEKLETFSEKSKAEANLINKIDNLRISLLFKLADFIICSSEKQRDLWVGWLSTSGRLNNTTYRTDRSFRNIIDVVAPGVRSEFPLKKRNAIRESISGIGSEDKIVLWFSGIWPWLDPFSAIKAINLINNEKIKLVFYGLEALDVNFKGEKDVLLENAIDLSKKLNLYNKRVFFICERLPYSEIADVLLDADIGLNIQFNHLETQYAYRGRLLEFIWANLPVIATRGDVLASIIEQGKSGIVVDYENEAQIADAIIKLINDREFYDLCKKNMMKISNSMVYKKSAAALGKFCKDPVCLQDNKSFLSGLSVLYMILSFYVLGLYYIIRFKIIRFPK